jgi:hypothetical protein
MVRTSYALADVLFFWTLLPTYGTSDFQNEKNSQVLYLVKKYHTFFALITLQYHVSQETESLLLLTGDSDGCLDLFFRALTLTVAISLLNIMYSRK